MHNFQTRVTLKIFNEKAKKGLPSHLRTLVSLTKIVRFSKTQIRDKSAYPKEEVRHFRSSVVSKIKGLSPIIWKSGFSKSYLLTHYLPPGRWLLGEILFHYTKASLWFRFKNSKDMVLKYFFLSLENHHISVLYNFSVQGLVWPLWLLKVAHYSRLLTKKSVFSW